VTTTNDGTALTPDQVLDALRALGGDAILDPDRADGPDARDLPDLLGAVAAVLDSHTMMHVKREGDTRHRWARGYAANLDAGHPAAALEFMLAQAAMRTDLHILLIAHAAASGVEYGRLAAIITEAAAVATFTASHLTGPPDTPIDPAYLRTVHRRIKARLRDARGSIDAMERHLRSQGFQL
jgi:hypothetical protein